MKNELKNYNVEIFGEEYALLSDETELEITSVAQLVNHSMAEIHEATELKDPKKIAVLAALRLASKVLQLEKKLSGYNDKAENMIRYLEKELQ